MRASKAAFVLFGTGATRLPQSIYTIEAVMAKNFAARAGFYQQKQGP
jgi:hypothetical protein